MCTTCSASSAIPAETSRRPSTTSSARSTSTPATPRPRSTSRSRTTTAANTRRPARSTRASVGRRAATCTDSIPSRGERSRTCTPRWPGVRGRRTRARSDRRIRKGRRAMPAVRGSPDEARDAAARGQRPAARARAVRGRGRRATDVRAGPNPVRGHVALAGRERRRPPINGAGFEIDPDNVRARMYLRIMASARGESVPPKP